ncbi:MAG TPA: hypothetical protein VNZ22_01660, partial [Bacillota bacterium]|nr:hypothetical protein [Bacillota bacterium]
MLKKLKRLGWPVLFLFGVGVVGYGYALWLREPVYENRELSAWLQQLVDLGEEGPSGEAEQVRRRAWEIPHEKAVGAVRSIGAEALPYLLRWLRSAPKPSPWCEKLQDLLDKQSVVNIKLRWGRDRTDEAIRGFRALGAAAAPALPELRRLLQRPATCYHAVLVLDAIGPCA